MNVAKLSLLWFRPISPLHYTLPSSLAQRAWLSTEHIPIDYLSACPVQDADRDQLQSTATWLLSSPTAAHLAAAMGGLGNPSCLAVMGAPTQAAWRAAGGQEPSDWLVSPTGESMGLFAHLKSHPKVSMLRGQQGRQDLIQALTRAGVMTHTVAVYHKSEHPQFGLRLNRALHASPVALYLSSTDQAGRLYSAALDTRALLASPVFASHERIAMAARTIGFESVTLMPT